MMGIVDLLTSGFSSSPQINWDTPDPSGPGQLYGAGPGGMLWPTGDTSSILSSNLNLASMSLDLFGGIAKGVGAIMQGQQEKAALGMQAKDQELQAREETIRGQQQSNQLMDNMLQTIGSQRLAYAANGMDISFGTPVDVENTTRKLTQNNIGIVDNNAAMNALARRKQAAALLEQGANTMSSADFAAAGDIVGGGINAWKDQQELIQRGLNRG